MNKLRPIWMLVYYNIQKWFTTVHTPIILFYFIFIFDMYSVAVRNFSRSVSIKATPFIFPLLLNDSYFLMLFMLGIVFAFGNAPFMDAMTKYMVIRIHKTYWVIAQVLYIFITSILLFLGIYLISILVLLPEVSMENSWGKIYGTLAQTSAGNTVQAMFRPAYRILITYTPMEALGTTLLIGILLSTMIGLLLFVSSMWLSRAVGLCITSFLVLFSIMAEFLNGSWANFLSPISFIRLGVTTRVATRTTPSVLYAIVMLIVIDVLLILFAIYQAKKTELK